MLKNRRDEGPDQGKPKAGRTWLPRHNLFYCYGLMMSIIARLPRLWVLDAGSAGTVLAMECPFSTTTETHDCVSEQTHPLMRSNGFTTPRRTGDGPVNWPNI
jgi:hypothetical protein